MGGYQRGCRRGLNSGPASPSVCQLARLEGNKLTVPNEDPGGKFYDLTMLVQYGGLERTREEFRALFAGGGFELAEVVPTRAPLSIIVARPTPAG